MNQVSAFSSSASPKNATLPSLAGAKNICAVLYLAVSMAPSLYLPPFFLLLIIGFGLLEVVYSKSATGTAPYVRSLVVMLSYFFLTGIASGLSLGDLLSYEAVRFDSNVIYSVLPLFFLGSGHMSVNRLDRWINVITIVATLVYGISPFIGFIPFESHNAAGGFFMILMAYLVGRALTEGFGNYWVALIFALVALSLSDSRGSAVAVIGAVGFFWMRKKWPLLSTLIWIASVLAIIVGLAVCYAIWKDNGAQYLYDYTQFGPASDDLDLSAFTYGDRSGTVLHRLFFLYPMAIDMFLHSPFFGIGFTRFDDFPLRISGWDGFIAFNNSNEINHSNLHAHNSYLHIAAETGVIGLLFLFLFLRALFFAFRASRNIATPVYIILGSLLIASLSEHRLTTPSQAAPAFIIVALMWACLKRDARQLR